jgi:hypothetical protein
MRAKCIWSALFFLLLAFGSVRLPAQETTGGLQGTLKDPTGAVVPGAKVQVTGTTLVGNKELQTDSSGYYHFANLPPGTYNITVIAKGFKELKRAGVDVGVGHLPTVDLTLEIGAVSELVEVEATAPVVDVTTTQNLSNVTNDVIENVPHGYSYQSVIQFAPMARNEPLAGYTHLGIASGGTGGSLPGSTGNGLQYGFSIGGSGDSENSYLIEGQDTEQLSGGYSKANVPFQFIQEVEIKTSGIEAEYGGALGGVANVVMKKGSSQYHGEFFTSYESDGLDADNNSIYLRYDPNSPGNPAFGQDAAAQQYFPRKDHFRIVQPGFTLGGPILKDRLWFFLGFAPQFSTLAKTVNFNQAGSPAGNVGPQYFTQDTQQYYGTARLDASLTQKIRVYASWLDQYARQTGASLTSATNPLISDPVTPESSFVNTAILSPLTAYSHGLGWVAPNSTYNFGADITLTPQIVSTTRFGYFFENYRDFGWQTQTPDLHWQTSGVGASDNLGNPLPLALAKPHGTDTAPSTQSLTSFNSNKHYQFNQDVGFFKSGWLGTHSIKVGYQLNHLVNTIYQDYNSPFAFVYSGAGTNYGALTATGAANCALLVAKYGFCAGQYGYLQVQDFATILPSPASDWNHAFYVQDAWNIGHGLTFNVGLRIEKETLPPPGGLNIRAIDFGWGDKVAPRLGVAWDPTGRGKMKAFFSYGVVNDVMKLLLAQSSWGSQAFETCSYALGPNGTGGFNPADINLVFKNGRACPTAAPNVGANFVGGSTPASLIDSNTGVSLIENVNLRPGEPVAPGLKPYRQHEFVAGWDYEISKDWAFEARYDRRRLDHVIEDASLDDPTWFEIYAVVNPGEGVNSTLDGYASFLQSLGQGFLVNLPAPPFFQFNGSGTFGTCPTCPPMPKAVRNYDGVEFRLTRKASKHWAGMFSYTWSRLWGNYSGLTTTDQSDGFAAGRNSPDTSRAFDEPFFYFGADGKSNNGPLPTDRPSTLKGNVYYSLPWKGMTTTFGLFQDAYQGTPLGTYGDVSSVLGNIPLEAVYLFGRGKWADVTSDASGNVTFGTPRDRRTPWFTQTDLQVKHSFHVNKNNEAQVLSFAANVTNLLNQHSVVQYYQGFNSLNFGTALVPGLVNGAPVSPFGSGAAFYNLVEHGYNPQQWVNGANVNGVPFVWNNGTATVNGTPVDTTLKPCSAANAVCVPRMIESSWYGQPSQYQLQRNLRFVLSFTF